MTARVNLETIAEAANVLARELPKLAPTINEGLQLQQVLRQQNDMMAMLKDVQLHLKRTDAKLEQNAHDNEDIIRQQAKLLQQQEHRLYRLEQHQASSQTQEVTPNSSQETAVASPPVSKGKNKEHPNTQAAGTSPTSVDRHSVTSSEVQLRTFQEDIMHSSSDTPSEVPRPKLYPTLPRTQSMTTEVDKPTAVRSAETSSATLVASTSQFKPSYQVNRGTSTAKGNDSQSGRRSVPPGELTGAPLQDSSMDSITSGRSRNSSSFASAKETQSDPADNNVDHGSVSLTPLEQRLLDCIVELEGRLPNSVPGVLIVDIIAALTARGGPYPHEEVVEAFNVIVDNGLVHSVPGDLDRYTTKE